MHSLPEIHLAAGHHEGHPGYVAYTSDLAKRWGCPELAVCADTASEARRILGELVKRLHDKSLRVLDVSHVLDVTNLPYLWACMLDKGIGADALPALNAAEPEFGLLEIVPLHDCPDPGETPRPTTRFRVAYLPRPEYA